MMISSKNVNQNMLKIPNLSEKICKNSPSAGGSTSRSQLAPAAGDSMINARGKKFLKRKISKKMLKDIIF